jgi:hypothetical protein
MTPHNWNESQRNIQSNARLMLGRIQKASEHNENLSKNLHLSGTEMLFGCGFNTQPAICISVFSVLNSRGWICCQQTLLSQM